MTKKEAEKTLDTFIKRMRRTFKEGHLCGIPCYLKEGEFFEDKDNLNAPGPWMDKVEEPIGVDIKECEKAIKVLLE